VGIIQADEDEEEDEEEEEEEWLEAKREVEPQVPPDEGVIVLDDISIDR